MTITVYVEPNELAEIAAWIHRSDTDKFVDDLKKAMKDSIVKFDNPSIDKSVD